jgi:hypothetical protein
MSEQFKNEPLVCGAVGDGITDDGAAFRAAHEGVPLSSFSAIEDVAREPNSEWEDIAKSWRKLATEWQALAAATRKVTRMSLMSIFIATTNLLLGCYWLLQIFL